MLQKLSSAHRADVINAIKERLKAGEPTRVVSTSGMLAAPASASSDFAFASS